MPPKTATLGEQLKNSREQPGKRPCLGELLTPRETKELSRQSSPELVKNSGENREDTITQAIEWRESDQFLQIVRTTENSMIVLTGHVHNHLLRVLADTGASKRYLSKEISEKLGLNPRKTEKQSEQRVSLPNGEFLEISGTVSLTLTIGTFSDTAIYFLIDLSLYDIILGMDFFMQYRPTIDYTSVGLRIVLGNTIHHLLGREKHKKNRNRSAGYMLILITTLAMDECRATTRVDWRSIRSS